MNEISKSTVCTSAREIADKIIGAARNSGDDPIAWVTGNSCMPPMRAFSQAEAIWQAGEDPSLWELLTELIESHLSDAKVALECPDYNNALYAVDLVRFESTENEDAETLQEEWCPVMTPGEAFRLISDTMPEELRGADVDKAFSVLYALVEGDIARREVS